MSSSFDIKMKKPLYEKLNIKHPVQNLPLIEWVCTQLDIPIADVDTKTPSCFHKTFTNDEIILTITTTNEYIAIMNKYTDVDYWLTEPDFDIILKEVYPIIQFVGDKIDENPGIHK